MATPSLELETGSGAIAGSGEQGKAGRWRGWVIPLGALLFWWFVSRHVVAGHGMMTSTGSLSSSGSSISMSSTSSTISTFSSTSSSTSSLTTGPTTTATSSASATSSSTGP